MEKDAQRDAVRAAYAVVAEQRGRCCPDQGDAQNPPTGGTVCCGTAAPVAVHAERLGYSAEEAEELGNLGVGCGNPTAIAALKEGEVVADLGAGGGFDCFLAARKVGPMGRVIGVDMTPEMVQTARRNAARQGVSGVEFRLGEIEHLPIADGEVDVILSNCVINLSPDKPQVFREAFRVLKPGGRLALSDTVATAPLPDEMRENLHLVSCCIGGAALVDDLVAAMESAGFSEVTVKVNEQSRAVIADWAPGTGAEAYVASAEIYARKAAKKACCG
jgi:SAM-dependent methyltransferase